VGIKILQDEFVSDLHFRARFMNEIHLTSQLEHPGIVPVYDAGQTVDGRTFYSFKLVPGMSLSEALMVQYQLQMETGKTFDPTPFLHHLLRVCDTLSYAHSLGVIHRDLKPDNIVIGASGEVMVMDWMLACLAPGKPTLSPEDLPESARQTVRALQRDLTTEVQGSIIGTPEYMAPEQARGESNEIDPQTDIYGLGAILYQILTGLPPYFLVDGDRAKILHRVRRGLFERPREFAPANSIPAALEAMVMKAMALEKRDRYPDVKAFRDDIQTYCDRIAMRKGHPVDRLKAWAGAARGWFGRLFVG
jgi:serine/threonine protein kinase